MIRDNTNLCQCNGPASQIPILVTAPPVKKKKKKNFTSTTSYSDKALMTFHDDASNSHVPDINFLEFLVDSISLESHHNCY